eukprot:gene20565-24699_t
MERIRTRLETALSPLECVLEDDSARHRGHAGAASGGGHYNLRIISSQFEGLRLVMRHRLVMAFLAYPGRPGGPCAARRDPARLLIALLAVVAVPVFAQNVAVVNGKPIPSSRVDAVVKQVVAQGQQPDSPQLREMIKKDLIGREVLMQEAENKGFGKDAAVKQQIENARQAIVINALVGDYLKKNPVTDAEIKAEYDKFVAQTGDKEYHVRHILVATEAEAKDIIAKLKGGLDDTRAAKLPTLEEVKPQIAEALQQKKLQASVRTDLPGALFGAGRVFCA